MIKKGQSAILLQLNGELDGGPYVIQEVVSYIFHTHQKQQIKTTTNIAPPPH